MEDEMMDVAKKIIADYQQELKQYYYEQLILQTETVNKLSCLGLDTDVVIELFMEATVEVTTSTLPASKDEYQTAVDLIKMGLPED